MYTLLVHILWVVFLLDFVLVGVLLIFFVNARINLTRQAKRTRQFLNVLNAAHTEESSYAAAERVGISLDEFTSYCKSKGIESPEDRIANIKRIEDEKRKQEQRILSEEAAWRAEQDRLIEDRQKNQERESQERRNRLKKFGFR